MTRKVLINYQTGQIIPSIGCTIHSMIGLLSQTFCLFYSIYSIALLQIIIVFHIIIVLLNQTKFTLWEWNNQFQCRMAIENVELIHEHYPQHLRMWTKTMKKHSARSERVKKQLMHELNKFQRPMNCYYSGQPYFVVATPQMCTPLPRLTPNIAP